MCGNSSFLNNCDSILRVDLVMGPVFFPSSNTGVPSFSMHRGSTAVASALSSESTCQEVPLESTRSLEFNSFCHSSPSLLYAPELPKVSKVFLPEQPFFKYI